MWTQNYDPLGQIGLSALVAAIPIFFLAWALGIKRMKGHLAAFWTLILTLVITTLLYKMPIKLSLLSIFDGMLYGLFPICWIVVTALFLYNLTVKTGQFEIVKDSIAAITSDRRLQALLIGFSFGAFLEGAAGFGAPVAITAAMLVGLGFNPLYAAVLCLVANTSPVAFGSLGIPILVGGQVSGIDAMAISKMVGRQLPFLSVLVPGFLVTIMSGFSGLVEVLPAVIVCGVSFALSQWFTSNYLTPMLPDIISAFVSIICLVLFLKVWKPKTIWRFPGEEETDRVVKRHSPWTVFRAWTPFIILTLLIGCWGVKPVNGLLGFVTLKFPILGLHGNVIAPDTLTPMDATFSFNWLSAGGTAILIAAIISAIILRVPIADIWKIFKDTVKDLKFALLTIMLVLGFAYLANFSGLSKTLGLALTYTGSIYPFLASFIGWIGVFITGSDTSSNALFAKLQSVAANNLGINPVLPVASNSAGGVAAKMISPQSIAVATASVGLVGKEGELFRRTILYSILFAAFIGVLSFIQAHYLQWMIPECVMAETAAETAINAGTGLAILGGIMIAVIILGLLSNKGREPETANVK